MENNLSNRLARPVGRPPNQPKPPEQPADITADPTERRLWDTRCPSCSLHSLPRLERWRPDGSADVFCGKCECRYVYIPARVRLK